MQNIEKGRQLEVATKLFLEKQGFTVYFWQEWALQKGLPLQDTGIDLVAEKDGDLYAVQCKNWSREVFWRDRGVCRYCEKAYCVLREVFGDKTAAEGDL
jgi:predicted helicase